jgi:transcription termination/antitermination protein NusA
MRTNEFMMALNALCHERDLSKDVVFDAIETALVAAYRRDFEHEPNIKVMMDRTTGDARVYVEWEVVDQVEDDRLQISLDEARERFGNQVRSGEVVREERTPQNFGRIAAQTAKQVILQRIKEAERDKVYYDYASREGEIVMGTVQSTDNKTGAVRLSLGKAEAVLPKSEQLPGERYRIGQRVRAHVAEVNRSNRGPQITVSRTHRQMLRRLLELEVPEIANGTVEIRAIAREPGARSKVAVAALQPGIDPVGACVGMKGIRIQSIVNELNGEKIDVVQWSPDESAYVANSLSPAKVIEAFLEEGNEEGKTAIVVVPDKQLSLAIGKEGQNARLAAKLTGWRIDIKSASEASDERVRLAEREARRREEEQQRRAQEEARLAAARALLAEAEAAASADEVIEETESAPDEAPVEAPAIAATLETPVPDQAVEAEEIAEEPAPVVEEKRPVPVSAMPQPRPETHEPPAPRQEPVVQEWEEEDEDEAQPEAPGKSKSPMIFYTLNARGEAQSLDDAVESSRRQKKKKKGRSEGPDRNTWSRDDASSDRGKSRHARRPWEDDAGR